MDKKFKRYKVDYAAAYRHYVDLISMTSEETAVKVEEQLQLARIQIAQMKDEIAELTSRPDWTAREKELNEHHARELYEQKMFLD